MYGEPEDYMNFPTMDGETYDELLNLVKPCDSEARYNHARCHIPIRAVQHHITLSSHSSTIIMIMTRPQLAEH